jgi:TP901 family phage tail tape measure protein
VAAEYQISFLIGAALSSAFKGSFASATDTMGKLHVQTQALSKNQNAIQSFQKLQGDVGETSRRLGEAQEKVRQLGAAMSESATPTATMQRAFSKAEQDAQRLQDRLAQQKGKLQELGGSMKSAGIDTKNLGAEHSRLAAEIDKVGAAQDRLQRSKGALDASQARLKNMKGEIMASAGIVMALGVPIRTVASFEQAMAKVQAVSGATAEEVARLGEQARRLGRDTEFTASEAAYAQELLARSGSKANEILSAMPGLLSMAAAEGLDLATATDVAASTLRGFNLGAEEAGRVADVLAKTSASTNTSIVTLGESMKYVAPVAEGLNIPMEEVAAMIGVMGDAGIKGSQAGTALTASLLRLSREPKMAADALAKLGVKARDLEGNMRTIPSLMTELSEKMKDMGSADRMEHLSKIFGAQAAPGLLAVMKAVESGKLNELTQGLYGASGAAAEMARIMNDTAQGAMKRLSSATESLMIDVGDALLPAFSASVEALASLTGSLSALAQEFPMVTKVLVGGVAALGAYKVGVTGLRLAWVALKLPFQHARVLIDAVRASTVLSGNASVLAAAKMKIVAVATKVWTGAQWLLNAALNANPIGLVIAAVAALAAGIYALWKNWDEVSAWMIAAWEKFSGAIISGWEWLKGLFVGIPEFIRNSLGGLADVIFAPFKAAFALIEGAIGFIANLWKGFMSIFTGDLGKIDAATNARLSEEAQAAAKRQDPSFNLAFPQYAAGGIVSSPQLALIGEAGREVVTPVDKPRLGIPLWMAAGKMMGLEFGSPRSEGVGSAYSPQITINVSGGADEGSVRRIEDAVRRVLRDEREQFARLSWGTT